MSETFKFKLAEQSPDHYVDGVPPEVELELTVSDNGQMVLAVEGHGDCGSADGFGHPIAMELYEGKVRLIAWSNINQEDPTHIIPMDGALERARRLTFEEWKLAADELFKQKTACSWNDLCGDDEPLLGAFENNETPEEYVDDQIDQMGLTTR